MESIESTPRHKRDRSGLAIASFVLSLGAMTTALLFPVISALMSILAIIFGVAGRHSSQRGLAIAGLVISISIAALGLLVLLGTLGFYVLAALYQ